MSSSVIEDIIENATKRRVRCRQAQFSHPLSLFSLVIDRITNSGGQVVAMMQTPEPGHCRNPGR
jgi:hypothetical protein